MIERENMKRMGAQEKIRKKTWREGNYEGFLWLKRGNEGDYGGNCGSEI